MEDIEDRSENGMRLRPDRSLGRMGPCMSATAVAAGVRGRSSARRSTTSSEGLSPRRGLPGVSRVRKSDGRGEMREGESRAGPGIGWRSGRDPFRQACGSGGKAYGLDMTDEMLALALENKQRRASPTSSSSRATSRRPPPATTPWT